MVFLGWVRTWCPHSLASAPPASFWSYQNLPYGPCHSRLKAHPLTSITSLTLVWLCAPESSLILVNTCLLGAYLFPLAIHPIMPSKLKPEYKDPPLT